MLMLFLTMNPILIAAAVIPALALLVKVYQADRLEKEPPGLLLSLVGYGVFATSLAMFTERLGMGLLDSLLPPESPLYHVLL